MAYMHIHKWQKLAFVGVLVAILGGLLAFNILPINFDYSFAIAGYSVQLSWIIVGIGVLIVLVSFLLKNTMMMM